MCIIHRFIDVYITTALRTTGAQFTLNLYGSYVKQTSYLGREFFKVEPITHIVIRTDCLWVVIHHDGLVLQLSTAHLTHMNINYTQIHTMSSMSRN